MTDRSFIRDEMYRRKDWLGTEASILELNAQIAAGINTLCRYLSNDTPGALDPQTFDLDAWVAEHPFDSSAPHTAISKWHFWEV